MPREVDDGFSEDVTVAIVPEGAVDVGGTVRVESAAEVALGVTLEPDEEVAEAEPEEEEAEVEAELRQERQRLRVTAHCQWTRKTYVENIVVLTPDDGVLVEEWLSELECEDSEWEEPVVVGLWELLEVVGEPEWLDEVEVCDDEVECEVVVVVVVELAASTFHHQRLRRVREKRGSERK